MGLVLVGYSSYSIPENKAAGRPSRVVVRRGQALNGIPLTSQEVAYVKSLRASDGRVTQDVFAEVGGPHEPLADRKASVEAAKPAPVVEKVVEEPVVEEVAEPVVVAAPVEDAVVEVKAEEKPAPKPSAKKKKPAKKN